MHQAKAQRLSNATPGPGDYFKSVPRGAEGYSKSADIDSQRESNMHQSEGHHVASCFDFFFGGGKSGFMLEIL